MKSLLIKPLLLPFFFTLIFCGECRCRKSSSALPNSLDSNRGGSNRKNNIRSQQQRTLNHLFSKNQKNVHSGENDVRVFQAGSSLNDSTPLGAKPCPLRSILKK